MSILGVIAGFGGGRIGAYPSQTFTPETYGAVGDGVADDNAAFLAMNAAILAAQIAEPQLRVVINFATNAAYNYTDNKWSWGFKYLTLEGNGASIRNTLYSVWTSDMTTWQTNHSVVEKNTDSDIGHLVDTALAGATSVTLKDPQLASAFAVGKWVCVASYSQQEWGWPPNPRYFDFSKVTAIDGGVITLDRPLQYKHRDNWPSRNAADQIDAARILAAEKNIPWADHWIIRNLYAYPNPNLPNGVVVQIEGFDKIELDNVNFPHWTCGQGRELIFRNSMIPSAEPDKILTLLRIENSTFGFGQASGIDLVQIIDSVSDGIHCTARNIQIEGSTFNASASDNFYWESIALGGFPPTMTAVVNNSTFIGPNRGGTPVFKGDSINEKIIGSTGFSLSGTDIIVDATDPTYWGNHGMSNKIYEGQRMLLKNSGGTTRGYGDVVSIESNGAPFTARIGVNWSVTPVNTDILQQFAVESIVGTNITMTNVPITGTNQGIAYLEWNGTVIQDLMVLP